MPAGRGMGMMPPGAFSRTLPLPILLTTFHFRRPRTGKTADAIWWPPSWHARRTSSWFPTPWFPPRHAIPRRSASRIWRTSSRVCKSILCIVHLTHVNIFTGSSHHRNRRRARLYMRHVSKYAIPEKKKEKARCYCCIAVIW